MAKALDRLVPGVDVVHTHLPFIYPTYAAAHAAFRHGKSLFYHQRGGFDPERLKFRSLKKMLYLRMIEISILKRATTLIALTGVEAATMKAGSQYTLPRNSHGIDTAAYSVSRDQALLETIGIGQQHAVVLFLGRIHPIRERTACSTRSSSQAGIPRSHAGLRRTDEFGLEASLQRRADVAGLSRSVIFPGWSTGPEKQLLARADLFCLPSAARVSSGPVDHSWKDHTPRQAGHIGTPLQARLKSEFIGSGEDQHGFGNSCLTWRNASSRRSAPLIGWIRPKNSTTACC